MLKPIALLLAALLIGPAVASSQWLHVHVDEAGGEEVRLQLPLGLVQAMLPLVEHEGLSRHRIELGDSDLSPEDLRQLLEALDEAADGEYVRVETEDADVRVAKTDGMLQVDVEAIDSWGEPETEARIRVPMAVVEALVAGLDEDTLDLTAAVRALDKLGPGELVTVDDADSRVRIWVGGDGAEL